MRSELLKITKCKRFIQRNIDHSNANGRTVTYSQKQYEAKNNSSVYFIVKILRQESRKDAFETWPADWHAPKISLSMNNVQLRLWVSMILVQNFHAEKNKTTKIKSTMFFSSRWALSVKAKSCCLRNLQGIKRQVNSSLNFALNVAISAFLLSKRGINPTIRNFSEPIELKKYQ